MNQDTFINKLAQISGGSRKQVIETLQKISKMPEIQREIKKRSFNK